LAANLANESFRPCAQGGWGGSGNVGKDKASADGSKKKQDPPLGLILSISLTAEANREQFSNTCVESSINQSNQ